MRLSKPLFSLLLYLLLSVSSRGYAADHCVVLQYHHFSETTPRITSVTPAQFDAHLAYLQEHDYKVLPLQEVVGALRSARELPDLCVSLSVDDAYVSVYETAFPRLRELGWPLTVFVNSGAVDQALAPYMSWDQMREMARAGVRFENHGHSHAHLIRKGLDESEQTWKARVTQDIMLAQQRITEELGRAPTLFAYPYGEFTPPLQQIVNSLNLAGFGQQSGPVWSGSDFTAMPRFPMAAGYAEMPGFRIKINTLPFPLLDAEPNDPLVQQDEWRPALTLKLMPGQYSKQAIRCFINGSDDVDYHWPPGSPDTLLIRPGQNLQVGRNRINCTMPSSGAGRYHWYSHNWIRPEADGNWYRE